VNIPTEKKHPKKTEDIIPKHPNKTEESAPKYPKKTERRRR
jgi:hypothetical protein